MDTKYSSKIKKAVLITSLALISTFPNKVQASRSTPEITFESQLNNFYNSENSNHYLSVSKKAQSNNVMLYDLETLNIQNCILTGSLDGKNGEEIIVKMDLKSPSMAIKSMKMVQTNKKYLRYYDQANPKVSIDIQFPESSDLEKKLFSENSLFHLIDCQGNLKPIIPKLVERISF